MFRLRRYRVFLIIAALTTLTVYHVTRVRNWEVADLESFTKFGSKSNSPKFTTSAWKPVATFAAVPEADRQITVSIPPAPSMSRLFITQLSSDTPREQVEASSEQTSSSVISIPLTTSSSLPTSITYPTLSDENRLPKEEETVKEFGEHGQGRLDIKPQPSGQPQAHWKPQKEHFPVPENELKVVPIGSAAALPIIQYPFGPESPESKADRTHKLETIKESFKHAWTGYTRWAMGHDELKPYTQSFADPFNGWGATLVDSLDSLWIMGLTEEFELAVGNVSEIDFTTSARKDIPLFETVIRYLGGLVSAYDLSGAKYSILLDKAVELAEILIGAFDTPNRMPLTYYYWAPSYASQPHRANVHVVLAELGSLSMEFTRLAQITKEAKYYDAVARITDALEGWQMNTTIPGLWPLKLDASGCTKADHSSSSVTQSPLNDPADLTWVPVSDDVTLEVSDPVQVSGSNLDSASLPLRKRQVDDTAVANGQSVSRTLFNSTNPLEEKDTVVAASVKVYTPEVIDCESQGLAEEPHSSWHHYSLSGMADSTYEYLPKEYMLLGGAVDQYRTMYKNAMKPVREKLLYRPMTKDGRDILFLAKADLDKNKPGELQITYEASHLACFAGGMFALGSKVFGIKSDMDIARKLTDGCIWAYESTTTGVMPEDFRLAPCDGLERCSWNETKYYDLLDPEPQQQQRIESAATWNDSQKKVMKDQAAAAAAVAAAKTQQRAEGTAVDSTIEDEDAATIPESRDGPIGIEKRQLDYSESAKLDDTIVREEERGPTKTAESSIDTPAPPVAAAAVTSIFMPKVPVSHEDFAQARIREERLPPGFTEIKSLHYKLRPEAIESVFIMYRTTGEQYWRDQGWKMFQAIESSTRTLEAHSAINDVTAIAPLFTDTMESFWLAETLKYFYLLFSDSQLISLDDYVLNTEAHPFRLSK